MDLAFKSGYGDRPLTFRPAILLAIDLCLVALATVFSLVLRDNFEINLERWAALMAGYLPISLANACAVFVVGRLDRGLWRHSSIADYLHIVALTAVTVLLSVGLGFAIDRLDGIPRSLPILQSILIVGSLVSARVTARLWFEGRGPSALPAGTGADRPETILIVGINAISDLLLRSMREYAPHYRIAGVLAVDAVVSGRTIQRNKILGVVEELHGILESLLVHGVTIDRILVTSSRRRLSQRAMDVLREVETSSGIVVDLLSERFRFDNDSQRCLNSNRGAGARFDPYQSARHGNSIRPPQRAYWKLKRAIDFCGALFLITLFAPIIPVIALLVALDVGFPVIFWQQRPGLHGQPFRLYKFRTMRASHDKYFKRVSDDRRLSFVGRFLRKLRLDELPQLYNVLIGDMSLVGPRPLLPHDQSPNFSSRLSVRPGLTGWAQVNGGRIISATDKATLDIWYVNKASFLLDVHIMLRTVSMVLLGDRINGEAICQARQDLRERDNGLSIRLASSLTTRLAAEVPAAAAGVEPTC
jgi:lipopolysaccharide/colanic/teichoic acid biosynthesis glycosyltransferase